MTGERASRPGRTPRGHLVVAFVSGLAVTILELTAIRFLAPWFGQSNYVLANVIGVVLLSLALGYWLGGRLADRSATARPLFFAYLFASLWSVAVAFLTPWLADWLLPAGVESSRILSLAFTGSLAAMVILFGPPTLVLGMTSPFLIRLDDAPGRAGRVSGSIFALGTVGSLVGCYVAPLWLLQTIGSRATVLLCAAALAALAVWGFRSARLGRPGAGAALALLGAAALAVWAAVERPPLRRLPGQVVEVESGYQTIRVVEEEAPLLETGAFPLYGEQRTARTLMLRHDEDAETYQSVYLPDDSKALLTGGRYFEHMALGARFARPAPGDTVRVLVVGYAGGAVHRTLRDTLPAGKTLKVLGVEIDPAVVEVARRHLDLASLEGDDLELVTGEDARVVVNTLPADRRFHLVLVDAYTRTNYVPFQVATVEFFERLAGHLEPGGWIGVNVLANRGMQSLLARSVAKTLSRATGRAWMVPNALYPGNLVLWASPGAERGPRLTTDELHPALENAAFCLERLAVRYEPGRDEEVVLTDDLSPSDRLADEELFGE